MSVQTYQCILECWISQLRFQLIERFQILDWEDRSLWKSHLLLWLMILPQHRLHQSRLEFQRLLDILQYGEYPGEDLLQRVAPRVSCYTYTENVTVKCELHISHYQ